MLATLAGFYFTQMVTSAARSRGPMNLFTASAVLGIRLRKYRLPAVSIRYGMKIPPADRLRRKLTNQQIVTALLPSFMPEKLPSFRMSIAVTPEGVPATSTHYSPFRRIMPRRDTALFAKILEMCSEHGFNPPHPPFAANSFAALFALSFRRDWRPESVDLTHLNPLSSATYARTDSGSRKSSALYLSFFIMESLSANGLLSMTRLLISLMR